MQFTELKELENVIQFSHKNQLTTKFFQQQ